jgi:hypothetical protein
MNIPKKDRENDEETLTKEQIHQRNKEQEQKMHSHENANPGKDHEHNPIHNSQERR